jgi:hypothetical protein
VLAGRDNLLVKINVQRLEVIEHGARAVIIAFIGETFNLLQSVTANCKVRVGIKDHGMVVNMWSTIWDVNSGLIAGQKYIAGSSAHNLSPN